LSCSRLCPLVFLSSYVTEATCFFFSSRRRHTISKRDWSSDVCSSDLNTRLRNMLSGKTQEQRKEENHLPIMIIGTSQETGDIVYQSVTTRRQNSIYMGP